MSGGEPGLHGIQGIGDGSKFLVDMDFVDEVVQIKTEDAKNKGKIQIPKIKIKPITTKYYTNLASDDHWINID